MISFWISVVPPKLDAIRWPTPTERPWTCMQPSQRTFIREFPGRRAGFERHQGFRVLQSETGGLAASPG